MDQRVLGMWWHRYGWVCRRRKWMVFCEKDFFLYWGWVATDQTRCSRDLDRIVSSLTVENCNWWENMSIGSTRSGQSRCRKEHVLIAHISSRSRPSSFHYTVFQFCLRRYLMSNMRFYSCYNRHYTSERSRPCLSSTSFSALGTSVYDSFT